MPVKQIIQFPISRPGHPNPIIRAIRVICLIRDQIRNDQKAARPHDYPGLDRYGARLSREKRVRTDR